jgi:tetratricopeptide (TPR) repeat protein
MTKSVLLIFFMAFYLSGCAAVDDLGSSLQDLSSTLKYNMQGEYYLYQQDFKQGRDTFKQAVQTDPKSPEAQYYFGRFLLAENEVKKALPYLKQATVLKDDKSEYYFWLGVAYGESGQRTLESKSYLMALDIEPNNIQALTYLGNNRLRAKKYKEALKYYRIALDLSYENPQALYNSAVALRKLGRTKEEKLILRDYMNTYPSGSFSRLATDRLNRLGDFTYRNHRLGYRTVTLAEITFLPSSGILSETSYLSLDLLGETIANMPKGTLNIVVYSLNNRNLAKKRAISIRNYLTKRVPELQTNTRIRLSWFGTAEKRVVLKKTLRIKESVQFFLTDFKN